MLQPLSPDRNILNPIQTVFSDNDRSLCPTEFKLLCLQAHTQDYQRLEVIVTNAHLFPVQSDYLHFGRTFKSLNKASKMSNIF